MVEITFLIEDKVMSETIHEEDLNDFVASAADHNITIVDIN